MPPYSSEQLTALSFMDVCFFFPIAVVHVSLVQTEFTIREESSTIQICANLTGQFERSVEVTITRVCCAHPTLTSKRASDIN